jgi:hypothetical protein
MNEIENRPAETDDYYSSRQYLADMNYESAMAGEHKCPTCGRTHEGAYDFCQTCAGGTCCEAEETEHHVETWFRYTAEELFGEAPTDDQRSLWRHAVEARTDLIEENNRLHDELQASREQIEELGNESVWHAEERDEAKAALEQAEAHRDALVEDQIAIETYLDYGDVPADNGLVDAIAAVRRRDRIRTALITAPADNGLVDAIAAVRRRDRIRTALITAPAALILGAAAALAAALL